ncbi:MAG: hypothetical protein COW03_02585 [Cytophagales bacterium CG12_big_fil_rev_8_21_14_0_65_40_12]|nr:MAG: hypothetical protein COW03_02585 [Cytophagales bacterium CG12_big_fil_rev_8_21_14_0_65_40_12]PIW03430.1 MAG: hypothetical protein COW40_14830 [Cytophagales bacterium CG17_big_fil_post_rev_8_21_14_2_50_40_13]
MIFFNLSNLEERLRGNSLQANHLFTYFMINIILVILSLSTSKQPEDTEVWIMGLSTLMTAIITIGFLIYLFDLCKRAGSENRFLEFYFSLGFVVVLNFAVFILIPIAVLIKILNLPLLDFPLPNLVLDVLLEVIFYYILTRSFQRVLVPTKPD